ncbi:hypothetical protein BHM03_00045541 [Ensete ventricosum]|nr:hypothetical protein BHM03_00045541 [Ensete ventricosum]
MDVVCAGRPGGHKQVRSRGGYCPWEQDYIASPGLQFAGDGRTPARGSRHVIWPFRSVSVSIVVSLRPHCSRLYGGDLPSFDGSGEEHLNHGVFLLVRLKPAWPMYLPKHFPPIGSSTR